MKLSEIIEDAQKAKLTLVPGIVLIPYSRGGEVVGVCGYLVKGKTGYLKFEYVIPEFRNRGILSEMIDMRIARLKELGVEKIVVNCMPMSLSSHIKKGAKILEKYKYGGAKVVYENIQ